MTTTASMDQAGPIAVPVGPIRVRVVESDQELASLAETWEQLQSSAVVTSVFQTFDWQHLWWKTYGRGQPLRVLLATAGPAGPVSAGGLVKGERVVGILPLYIQTAPAMRVPVRLLRPIGIGGDTSPDDLGAVLAPGCETEVARALAEAVMELPGWDVLLLTDMMPDCAFTSEIRSAVKRRHLPSLSGRSERIAFMNLPATWDAWLESMHRDRRWRIRNTRKKFHAANPARFFVWNDPATLDTAIDRLVFLHNKRWNSIGEVHGFSTPEYVGFHRSVMHACLKRDRLRLYCLEMAGQVVAMFYFYRFRNRVYLMQSGFDPDHSKLKPGQVLLHHIVEDAIKEGNGVLDFLRGDHRYKEEIATGERETVHVTALRRSVGALAYGTRRIVLPAVKARVMSTIRDLRARGAKAS